MNIKHSICFYSLAVAYLQTVLGFSQDSLGFGKQTSNERTKLKQTIDDGSCFESEMMSRPTPLARREFVGSAAMLALMTGLSSPADAATSLAASSDGNLPELPSEAVRSYLQYRIPLQIAADYYIFSLQDMIGKLSFL